MAYAYSSMDEWGDPWAVWRQGVVATIRFDFPEVLQDVSENDIDWEAWRPLYDQGYSPQAAVDQAFVRNV
jgi:hypothetical protein